MCRRASPPFVSGEPAMKINLPVSQVERHLKPGHPIVTKTDLKGLITYANAAFVEISGFAPKSCWARITTWCVTPTCRARLSPTFGRPSGGAAVAGLVRTAARMAASTGRCLRHANQRRRPHQRFHVGAQRPERNAVREAEALYRAVRDKHKRYPATTQGAQHWPTEPDDLGSCGRRSRARRRVRLAGRHDRRGRRRAGGRAGLDERGLLPATHRPAARGASPSISAPSTRATSNAASTAHAAASPSPSSQLEAMRIHLRAMFADVLVASREVENRSHDLEQAMASLSQATTSQASA